MGFRFRRSIKICPGVRINLGKRSASLSIGPRGFKTTIGGKGIRQTIGIPGTGISYTKTSTFKAPKTGLEALTVVQLKDILRSKGLSVSGRKSELIERIQRTTNPNISLLPNEQNKMPEGLTFSKLDQKRKAGRFCNITFGAILTLIALIYFFFK